MTDVGLVRVQWEQGGKGRAFGAVDGLWVEGCGCGGRKSKCGLQDPVRNEDIHVGQREQGCKMQLEGDPGVRVGLDAEMLVTWALEYVSTAW